ncbi:MAG: hypothetical protein M9907_05995 [Burkholderiaceae bacterium]|nr:hypothetical protein [Burkholderiaceae bacterium]
MRLPRLELPAVAAILAAMCGLLAFPLSDYDYFWHLRTGQLILETGAIPTTDPFSFTAAGLPWPVQGWLFDAAIAWVHRALGDTGVRAFFVAWLLATWAVVHAIVRLFITESSRALAVTLVSAAGASMYFVARPYVATFLGFALTLFLLSKHRETGQRAWLLGIPPTMAVWVNLHFGFVTGLGLIVLVCLADLLSREMPLDGAQRAEGRLTPAAGILLIAASIAALGLNPLGYSALSTTLEMTRVSAASVVVEWQSPDFHHRGGQAFLGMLCIAGLARILSRKPPDWLDLALLGGMSAAALYSMRFIPLAAIAMAPVMARAFTGWSPMPWKNRWAAILPARLQEGANKDIGERRHALNWALCVLMVLALLATFPWLQAWRDARLRAIVPVDAATFIEANKLSGRILNDYGSGGYLIYRLHSRGYRVFVDGRYTPYPPAVIDDYLRVTSLAGEWLSIFDRYRIDVVLVPSPDQGFAQALTATSRFRLVYADRHFGVLIPNDGRRPDLPDVQAPRSLPRLR